MRSDAPDHGPAAAAAEGAVSIDNRGLEPPMPMVRTLQAYEALSAGGTLVIHNDRVPTYLLPQLAERGALVDVAEQPDGSAVVTIRKPGGGAAP